MARPIRLLLVLALALAPLTLWVTPASAAGPTFTVTPNPAAAGDSLTFSGTQCLPVSSDPAAPTPQVYLSVEGDDGASDAITPDVDGTWSYTMSLPQGIPTQTVTFDAVCDGYTSSFGYVPVTVTIRATADGAFLFLPAFVDVWNRRPHLQPGTPYEFDAFGFTPGEQVTLDLHSELVKLGTYAVNDRGEVIGTFVLPADTASGPHELVLTGVATEVTASLAVVVTAVVDPSTAASTVTPSASSAPASSGSPTTASTTAVSTVTLTGTTSTVGPGLAATGAPGDELLLVGGVLALLGAGVVWLARRPKTSSPARRRRSH